MKPIYESITTGERNSFSVKRDVLSFIDTPLHFHEEYEWVLNISGTGKRFVGDNISDFDKGDLVFIGEHLPHYWKNSPEYYQGKELKADLIIVHFKKTAFGDRFFDLPEMKNIEQFLSESKKGIEVTGDTRLTITKMLFNLIDVRGVDRLLKLIEVLKIASEHREDWNILSKSDILGNLSYQDSKRLQTVFQYLSENYDQNISLDTIAKIAHMNKSSFSRYFKAVTKKGFVNYLNELRINYAKKLLLSSSEPTKAIGYKCGFSNSSYFIKTFRAFTGKTPVEYRITKS